MLRRVLVALLVAGAGLVPAAAAAPFADATLDEYFRVTWEVTSGPRGPAIAGYVANVSNLPVDRMRLVVHRLDGGGTVIGESTIWVNGLLPAHSRGFFSTPVPSATSYRVRVLSFDWANCRD